MRRGFQSASFEIVESRLVKLQGSSGRNSEVSTITIENKAYFCKQIKSTDPARLLREVKFGEYLRGICSSYASKFVGLIGEKYLVYELIANFDRPTDWETKFCYHLQAFLAEINTRAAKASLQFQAAENCLSLPRYLQAIGSRFEDLIEQSAQGGLDCLKTAETLLQIFCVEKAEIQSRYDFNTWTSISENLVMVSPGDIGTHNAIWTGESFVFFDFEFGGRDFIGKAMLDFLFHPGCELDSHQRYDLIPVFLDLMQCDARGVELTLVILRVTWLKWALIIFKRELQVSRKVSGDEIEHPKTIAFIENGRKTIEQLGSIIKLSARELINGN